MALRQIPNLNRMLMACLCAAALAACNNSSTPSASAGAGGSSPMSSSEPVAAAGNMSPPAAIGGAAGTSAAGTGVSSSEAGSGGSKRPAAASGSGGSGGSAGKAPMQAEPDAGPASEDASMPDSKPEPKPLEPFEGEGGEPWTAPAPRAKCGPNDQTDGAISGLSEELRCNLELAGKVEAPHFLSLAWHKDCAYVNGPDGTTVIQVAADGTPKVTTTLTEVGFRANWESMKASSVTGLLVGYEANGALLTTYDLTKDCAKPELASSLSLNGWLSGSIGHAGSFAPDGTIYYASSMYTGEVFAVDLAMPKQPKVITNQFDHGAHDLFVGKNGTRGYFAVPDVATQALGVGSFAVMDLSQIQSRAPNAKGTVISEMEWEDGSTSQYPILMSYRGKDFLFINDELGLGACGDEKKPAWGYGRIFDMSDEKKPKLVSLIKTEAHDPKNCEAAGKAEGGTEGFGVSTHYCNVDRFEDPRLLSCGIQAGGLRIYDIRNPWRPKEVAYFSRPDEAVPGMQRIHTEKRELWLATQPGTFYVMKFPPGSAVDQILSE